MAVRTRSTYLRSNFFARQENETKTLTTLYETMPLGVEQKFQSVKRLSASIRMPAPFLDHTLRKFEDLGILTRRLEYNAKSDDGRVVNGRSYHWTLQIPQDEAIARLASQHEKEKAQADRPPVFTKSLKLRIMNALNETSRISTMDDLAKKVRVNGENLDYHNLTHVMESLAREGKIDFERGKTKDHIPYNIRLTKAASKSFSEMPTPILVVNEPEMEFEEAEPIKSITDIVQETHDDWSKYPTVMKLIKRREWLEKAARLAEDANEEDIAISLLDRANKPLTALESEAIALYDALIKCRG